MQELIKIIRKGWPEHKSQVLDLLRPYWDCRNELSVAYEMVWKGTKIVIPKCMRKDMLVRIHLGHLGVEKCKSRARDIMYWPNMNSQILDMISHCQACLTYRRENSKQELISHEVPDRAWMKVGIDIFHFAGKSYLILIDYYSKFIEVNLLQSMTSLHVIDHLKIIFCRQGIPNIVMSDNGPEFSSRYFKEFASEWKFQHITSSPKFPQSNGQVERAVQVIKNMLRKTSYDQSDFRLAMLEYLNTPINENLGSPSQLLNNRSLRGVLPRTSHSLEPKIIDQKLVKSELQHRQQVQKFYYDRGCRNLSDLNEGDKVKVRLNGEWMNGVILENIGLRSYSIKLHTGRVIRRNRRQIIKDSQNRNDNHAYVFDDENISSPNEIQASLPSNSAQNQVESSTQSQLVRNRNNDNLYVTKSGRVVRPPDRYGY